MAITEISGHKTILLDYFLRAAARSGTAVEDCVDSTGDFAPDIQRSVCLPNIIEIDDFTIRIRY